MAREKIAQARQERSQTVPERPLVAESQSNGIIKRTVGLVAGQARTLKAALEDRIGAKVPLDARKLCWLVEFAANLMSRVATSAATERRRHTDCMDEGKHCDSGFGSRLCTCSATPERGVKWDPRFYPGMFMGMLNSSSEAVAVTDQGSVIKTRAANVRRIPESERWDAHRILGMSAVPWSPDGSDNA